MRIHHKGGGHTDVAIEQIDSITFVDGSDSHANEGSLVGSWLWGDAEAGYYELLTFNEDKTYTGYDNYFTYGFDTMTYGWYMQMGSMLTLQSNGYGYNRRYNWFVKGLSENALDVMTKMGGFIYYRLQPEVLHLQVDGEPLACENNGSFVFVDGVIACIVDGGLQGVAKGTTYVLKHIDETDCIMAYKVVVNTTVP
ncbi:MAG: hypothetical protein IJP70_01500 [Bacteroidales bacterium]|nr:hypothetical protein [Bacteroidales bacterium]